MKTVCWVAALAFALHAAPSPQGRWRTIDDETGKPKSIVRLWVEDGKLYGKVDSIFPEPGKNPDPLCEKCPGDFRGKRVKDVRFLYGLVVEGDEWSGGEVLDPNKGKIYRCKLRVDEDNKALTVRGYIGVSLIGRSQRWERVE